MRVPKTEARQDLRHRILAVFPYRPEHQPQDHAGGATALVGRIYGGVAMAYGNSTSVPFDRQFYCRRQQRHARLGAPHARSGFGARPARLLPDTDGRRASWRPTSNCAFPIWGMVHGATFFDLGNIWYIRRNPPTTPMTPSFFSTSFTSSWDSIRVSACVSTSSSPCSASTGVCSSTIPTIPRRTVDTQPALEEYRAQFRRRVSLLTSFATTTPRSAAAGVSYAGGCAYCRICAVRHAPSDIHCRICLPAMHRRMRIADVFRGMLACQFCALYCEGDMPVLRLK